MYNQTIVIQSNESGYLITLVDNWNQNDLKQGRNVIILQHNKNMLILDTKLQILTLDWKIYQSS